MSTPTDSAAETPLDVSADRGSATGVGQAYLLYFVCLLLVVFVGSLVQLKSFSLGLLFTELFCLLLPAVVFVRRKGVPVAAGLGLAPIPVSLAVAALLVGVCGWGAAAGVARITARFIGPSPVADLFRLETPRQLVTMIVCGAIAAGVCEEALFRGVIQGVLQRRGPTFAVLTTAALFAAFHLDPWNVIALFGLGTVFGVMAVVGKSTLPAMCAHFANNATSFTVAYVLRDSEQLPTTLLVGLSLGFVVSALVFWRLGRRQPERQRALARVPAALPTVVAWLLGICGAALAAAFAACFVAFLGFLQLMDVQSTELEPELAAGQKALVQKNTFVDFPINEGDLVAFRREGRQEVARVTRVADEEVWIELDGAEQAIPRASIFGKVIQGL